MRTTRAFIPTPPSPERKARAAVADRIFRFHGQVNTYVSDAVQSIMEGADIVQEVAALETDIKTALARCTFECAGTKEKHVQKGLKPAR